MNFYEFYNLINENTVSQEIKKNKLIPVNELNKMLKYAQESVLTRFQGTINEKSSLIIAKWIIYQILNTPDTILIIKDEGYKESDFKYNITWNISGIRDRFGDFIIHNVDPQGNLNQNLVSKFNNPSFDEEQLVILSHEYHENLKKRRGNTPGTPGKTLINFPDGIRWVDVGKGYCEREAASGLHCGNVGMKPGDNILSLRNNKDHVLATFIINDGILVERKAKENKKPEPNLHPYIIELLKLPMIKGLGTGRYLPQNDFKLTDLNQNQLEGLLKIKPEFKTSIIIDKIQNEKLSKEEIYILADSEIESHKKLLAEYIAKRGSSEVPSEVLNKLSDDNDPEIKRDLCIAKDIPIQILEKLSNDHNIIVKCSVAQNNRTPIKILEKLGNEDNPLVKRCVAGNNATPIEILEKLSEDDHELVQIELAVNPKTPEKTLFKLVEKGNIVLLGQLAQRINLKWHDVELNFKIANKIIDNISNRDVRNQKVYALLTYLKQFIFNKIRADDANVDMCYELLVKLVNLLLKQPNDNSEHLLQQINVSIRDNSDWDFEKARKLSDWLSERNREIGRRK